MKNKNINIIIPDAVCCICGRKANFQSPSGRWFCGLKDCHKEGA